MILITDDPVHHLDAKAIQQLRKPGTVIVVPPALKARVPDAVVLANGASTTVAGVRVDAIAAYDLTPGAPEHPKGQANGYLVTLGGTANLRRRRDRVRSRAAGGDQRGRRLHADEHSAGADDAGRGGGLHEAPEAKGCLRQSLRSGHRGTADRTRRRCRGVCPAG